MKNILIPTDFSDNAWNALKYGLELFKKSSCTFHIIHINAIMAYGGAPTPMLSSTEVLEDTLLKESRVKLKRLLTEIERLPMNTKHRFETLAVQEFFTDAIKKQVKEKNIDLIIMGTKGASGLKEMTMGSNTGDVITKIKCPLLAVPENTTYHRPKEIAFPTSYHLSYDIKVLDNVLEMAKWNQSAVRFLYISTKGESLSAEQTKNQSFLNDYFSEVEHSFHKVTGRKLESAVQCFTESRAVDMIAMVAKNLNFLQRILFRPAVEKISYHTDIPFLVLHE